MQAFSAKYIFDGQHLLENKAVLVANNLIVDIVDKKQLVNPDRIIEYGDGIITPGFIDLQLNGCGGVLFNNAISLDTLEVMYQTCLKSGTLGFLPTLITSPFNDVLQALETVKKWFNLYDNKRGVIGLHLEGPFLSRSKPGIHPVSLLLKPENELLEQIVAYAKFFPIKMTIAVEEFHLEQIQFLHQHKIILAVGHSNASYEEVVLAIKNGVSTTTHLFNAMSGLTGRNPGVIGAVLNNDIYAGLIVDMLHVDKANVLLTHKIKAEKVYLVTDAVAPTGTAITEFEFAGQTLYVKDGKCVDANGTLGGAYLTMAEAVANTVKHCQIDLLETLKMASLIPARVMKLDDILGTIQPGFRADLIYLDLTSFETKVCR